jgi:hypothetical protein
MITNYVQVDGDATIKEMVRELGNASRTPADEFLKHKIAIVVDGNTGVASRSTPILRGNSALLWQETEWAEFFYSLLRPYIHYIPLGRGLEDLYTQLEWAQQNEAWTRRIAENGQAYANDHFNAEAVDAYFGSVLTEYARLQRFTVTFPVEWEKRVVIAKDTLQWLLRKFPWCASQAQKQKQKTNGKNVR